MGTLVEIDFKEDSPILNDWIIKSVSADTLLRFYKNHLSNEEYEKCAKIKAELNKRGIKVKAI